MQSTFTIVRPVKVPVKAKLMDTFPVAAMAEEEQDRLASVAGLFGLDALEAAEMAQSENRQEKPSLSLLPSFSSSSSSSISSQHVTRDVMSQSVTEKEKRGERLQREPTPQTNSKSQ